MDPPFHLGYSVPALSFPRGKGLLAINDQPARRPRGGGTTTTSGIMRQQRMIILSLRHVAGFAVVAFVLPLQGPAVADAACQDAAALPLCIAFLCSLLTACAPFPPFMSQPHRAPASSVSPNASDHDCLTEGKGKNKTGGGRGKG